MARKYSLFVLLTIMGIASFCPLAKASDSEMISGKNVNVYLEDAAFGYQTTAFTYDPNAQRLFLAESFPLSPPGLTNISRKSVAKTLPVQEQSILLVAGTSPNAFQPRPSIETEALPHSNLPNYPTFPNEPVESSALPAPDKMLPPPPPVPAPRIAFNYQPRPTAPVYPPNVELPSGFENSTAANPNSINVANPIIPIESSSPREVVQTEPLAPSVAQRTSNLAAENFPSIDSSFSNEIGNFPEGISKDEAESLIDQKGPKFSWKKGNFSITPYGYINVSTVWESQRTVNGDYCVYALSPELVPQSDRSAFYIDPRSTRLGIKIDGPGLQCWNGSKSRAVVEIDFQGSYLVRNRSGFLFRKAFVELGDKNTKFLFGQDWEIFSPLYPNIFNYPAGSGCGNLGYRRAMIKMDHTRACTSDSAFLFQVGICDNTIRDYTSGAATDPKITASGWPVVQGRIAYSFGEKTFGRGAPITVGFSAQIGEQRGDFLTAPIEIGDSFRTWAICLDLDIPITKKMRLQAELYNGENLSNLEGGILQGIDMVRRDTIRCRGGWGALQYQWTKKLKTNVGYAIEDPYNQDLLGTALLSNGKYSSRTYNHSIFGNVMYNWTEAFMTGLEVSKWRTNWRLYDSNTRTISGLEPGEPLRFEFVARYTF